MTIQKLFESDQSFYDFVRFWRVVRVDLVFTSWKVCCRNRLNLKRLGALQIARFGFQTYQNHPGENQKKSWKKCHEIGIDVWCDLWNDAESAHMWPNGFSIQKERVSATLRGHKRLQRVKLLLEKAKRQHATSGLVDWWEVVLGPQSSKQLDLIRLNDRLIFQRWKPTSAMIWAKVT